MGSGKSTIGKYLSKKLNMNYIDTDFLVEQCCNMSIPQLFKLKGENYFRHVEHIICQKIHKLSNNIISSGGGTLLNEKNVSLFRDNCIIVYIYTPFEICYSRIFDSDRPIIKHLSKEELIDLYNKRILKYYKLANIVVSGE